MPWSNRTIPRAEPDAARRDGWLMLLLWLLVIAERLLYIKLIPSADDTVFVADAPYYYTSGLAFSQTGRIVYSGCPTALIMPGMPILIGIVARFFADGPALILALQVLWVLMGSLVPLFLYRSLRLFTRRSCAFLCSLIYLLPWHMEIDRYLLTECPYYLFFAMALYFMLRLGQDGARGKSEWFFALSVLGALLFRANILLFIVFAFLYWLLLRKFTLRALLRRALILSLVLGLFLVPWTIRNARLFHAFIPVTYGAGNPVFEGSYQGENPPTDKEIDDLYGGYDVYAELAAERPDLLDETGKVYDPAM